MELTAIVTGLDLGTASAVKRGRRPEWPYVPVVANPTSPTSPKPTTTQIKGLAYATRDEAINAAQRHIDALRASIATKLADPSHRALREQYGLPREIAR